MRAPRLALAAAAILALEALALLAIVVIELAQFFAGSATSSSTALALIVLTAIGAAALGLFAVGVARGRSWARSGGVVLHVLAIVVAIASLTTEVAALDFDAALRFALVVGVPGVVGFVLLIASARQEGVAPAEGADAARSADPASGQD